MLLETIACANELCNCVVNAELENDRYCGDACRNAVESGIEAETCPCGHPPCDTP